MPGANAPEDLRCPCSGKFGEVTSIEIVIKCRGCNLPIVLPFTELHGKEGLLAYLSRLPPRKPRSGRRPRK